MQNIAECAGLWLAEGNNKCNNEITFTNSSRELILHFHLTLSKLFPKYPIRVYCYSKAGFSKPPIKVERVKNYVDVRARRPYFIWRLASVEAMREWKKIVNRFLETPANYPDVLRGFFAGEGNIKTGSHGSRTIRIAQKNQKEFIDKMLVAVCLSFTFHSSERAYYLTGKWNWNIFHKLKLAELHPEKKLCFNKAYRTFKEEHYPNDTVRGEIIRRLHTPQTSKQLSKEIRRSQARISEMLVALKKEGIIRNFRVRCKDYWVLSSKGAVIISKLKERYLNALSEESKTTAQLARLQGVSHKAAQQRLNEMVKLGLVARDAEKKWFATAINKEIIVI